MTDRAAFGLELRRARERRGLSLEAIADLTKVSAGYFAGLERGDLSRWPSGIFRRAFVRSYADAVGLDAEDTVARFVRLFPDPHAEETPQHPARPPATPSDEPADAPRLVLADARVAGGQSRVAGILRGCAAALVDIALAAVPAAVITPFLGWANFWLAIAAIGCLGHVTVLAATGLTPGTWLLLRPRSSSPIVHDSPAVSRRRADDATAPPPPVGRRHQLRPLPGGRAATRSRRVSH